MLCRALQACRLGVGFSGSEVVFIGGVRPYIELHPYSVIAWHRPVFDGERKMDARLEVIVC